MTQDRDATRTRHESLHAGLELRNRVRGHAVSIAKAGAGPVGRDAGPVRSSWRSRRPDALDALNVPIDKLGSQDLS